MRQLILNDIMDLFNKLQHTNMTMDEILNLPIYIGDDDELNGIHCGWYAELVDAKDKECKDIVDLINDNYGNHPLKTKAILIS